MKRDYSTLRPETIDSHLMLVTLNRPEVSNALNTQMGRDLLVMYRLQGSLSFAHYYRPAGLRRERQQPWLATVWRR
jgi:hypothetical protein